MSMVRMPWPGAKRWSWNFGLARPVSHVVVFLTLGVAAPVHHVLRWAALAAFLGAVAADTLSYASVRRVADCVARGECASPLGHSPATLDAALGRDAAAVVCGVCAACLTAYLLAVLGVGGAYHTPGELMGGDANRAEVMRRELAKRRAHDRQHRGED